VSIKLVTIQVDKIDLTDTDVLSADKEYDSKALIEQIERTSTKANIPKKSNALSNNHYMDWHLYKIRHLVENTFARIKQFRGISTCYDKLKQNYENSVALACIFIWLPL
jgi:transposase